jgi:hypothetical protein
VFVEADRIASNDRDAVAEERVERQATVAHAGEQGSACGPANRQPGVEGGDWICGLVLPVGDADALTG